MFYSPYSNFVLSFPWGTVESSELLTLTSVSRVEGALDNMIVDGGGVRDGGEGGDVGANLQLVNVGGGGGPRQRRCWASIA